MRRQTVDPDQIAHRLIAQLRTRPADLDNIACSSCSHDVRESLWGKEFADALRYRDYSLTIGNGVSGHSLSEREQRLSLRDDVGRELSGVAAAGILRRVDHSGRDE